MATIVEADIKKMVIEVEAMVTAPRTIVKVVKRITLTKLEVIPTPLYLAIALILRAIMKFRRRSMFYPRSKWIIPFRKCLNESIINTKTEYVPIPKGIDVCILLPLQLPSSKKTKALINLFDSGATNTFVKKIYFEGYVSPTFKSQC